MAEQKGKYRGWVPETDQGEGDGEWVYGYYCKITGRHYIIPDHADCDWVEGDVFDVQGLIEVDGKTVGQSTGKHDKNNKEIYEGAITNAGVVEWLQNRCAWVLKSFDEDGNEMFVHLVTAVASCLEITGNIHGNADNPPDTQAPNAGGS